MLSTLLHPQGPKYLSTIGHKCESEFESMFAPTFEPLFAVGPLVGNEQLSENLSALFCEALQRQQALQVAILWHNTCFGLTTSLLLVRPTTLIQCRERRECSKKGNAVRIGCVTGASQPREPAYACEARSLFAAATVLGPPLEAWGLGPAVSCLDFYVPS